MYLPSVKSDFTRENLANLMRLKAPMAAIRDYCETMIILAADHFSSFLY